MAGTAADRAIVFQDHVEARAMGDHVREFRFPEPVAITAVRVLDRAEKPYPDSSFEGRTFPDVRTMSLSVYASDRLAANSSTMMKLRPSAGAKGTFSTPGGRLVTDCVVVRGKYVRLSLVIYGQALDGDEAARDDAPAIAAHLRPAAAFDEVRLDLADNEGGSDIEGLARDAEAATEAEAEAAAAAAPTSLARAVGLGALAESNAKIAEHADWVASLPDKAEVLEGEEIVQRLEALVKDLGTLAQKMPDANAAHISYGPVLARALLALTSRCMERLEFRPLRAGLRALAAALCAAPTAVEVLRRGGLAQLLAVLRETEWSQMSSKLAALQAVLQLSSHTVGVEALLGWSGPGDAVAPAGQGTGYEAVVLLAVDGVPGHSRMEQTAVAVLRRASFYQALVQLDASCARLGDAEGGQQLRGDAEAGLKSALEALEDVAEQFEELSRQPAALPDGDGGRGALLEEDCPSAHVGASDALALAFGSSACGDPYTTAHPKLHGFLESYISGRRLLPGLCSLLRRLPRLTPRQRVAVFTPARRLICSLLACAGGPQFLAAESSLPTLLSLLDGGGDAGKAGKSPQREALPAVPRFPVSLAGCEVGAPELAALVSMHVKATRLVLALVALTRQKGRNGIIPEAEGVTVLASLHQLCARGAAGGDAIVCAFRSVFLTEWLLRQVEARLDDTTPGGGTLSRPTLRHLLAILHTVLLGDAKASVAERFGARALAATSRALQLFEADAVAADTEGGAGSRTVLEFALTSDGEGGLGRAVRKGRQSADLTCLRQLRELAAQLRPWQQAEGEETAEAVPLRSLLASLELARAPRAFKKDASDEKGTRLSLLAGGYCGAGVLGVEIPEVDFGVAVEGAPIEEGQEDRERFPTSGLEELPLLAVRALCRRASAGAREALKIAVGTDSAVPKDGLALMVPLLVRCAASLSLNLEARVMREHGEAIDRIYASQHAHSQVLEATLQTCHHLLLALREAGLTRYQHTELLYALLLLADRLTSGAPCDLPGLRPGGDPEFRLLRQHCLAWTCRVFRTWAESFPDAAGGQLLQPLLRHARVLPSHAVPGLLLLATCGSLAPLLPSVPHSFEIAPGRGAEDPSCLQSRPLLLPSGTRAGAPGRVLLKAPEKERDAERSRAWGQLWGADHEAQDWDSPDAHAGGAPDKLAQALEKRRQTAGVASALRLVSRVNQRRQRLCMDDIAETVSLAAQCSVTSDALLHLVTARVLEKLTRVGVPVLAAVLKLGEAALQGPDQRDARAVSRILLLLAHFGARGAKARQALVEHRAETLCLSVLSHSASVLPPMATTQAIRVLHIMFCSSDHARPGGGPPPSVPKCRMVAKALSLLINREEGQLASPAALAAGLELLLHLSSSRSMCLNLLFGASEESVAEGAPVGFPVPVTVSCAFRLAQCAQRFARELGACDERWVATKRNSQAEAEAEEVLSSWLHAGELLVNLCQTVLVNCPTASVFLAVVLPSAPGDNVDEATLKGVLSDVNGALTKITGRTQRAETVPLRAAALVGNLRALQRQLLDTKIGPPPATLTREELCPPRHPAGGAAAEDPGAAEDVLDEVVLLFDAAATLEADPVWGAVAQLDTADVPAEGARGLEFDAAALRGKRQAALEKAEAERRAKRQKLAVRNDDRGRDDRGRDRRRAADSPPRGGEKAARSQPPTMSPPAASPPPGAPTAVAPAGQAAQAAKAPAADSQAAALSAFLKDHPEFMRVLQNPKKCLGDPRVKSMFVAELQNYPMVKAFLAAKGLNLN